MTSTRTSGTTALHADAERPSRREQILQAAAQLFAERGFHGVAIDDIGAAVGVSGPALYRHFAGKEAMLAEMLLGISERLLAGGSERVADAGDDPAAQLRALIAFQVDFALDHPALITVQDRDLGIAARRRRRRRCAGCSASTSRCGSTVLARLHPARRRRHLRAARARRLRADQLHPAQRRPARPAGDGRAARRHGLGRRDRPETRPLRRCERGTSLGEAYGGKGGTASARPSSATWSTSVELPSAFASTQALSTIVTVVPETALAYSAPGSSDGLPV